MTGASIRWFCLRVLPLLLATITAASGEANAVQIIYASSTFEGVVYRIDPSGAKSVFAAGLGHPEGVTVDSQGNVYVADEVTDRIVKITPSGVQTTFYQFPDSHDNPVTLAFGADGALYVGGTIDAASNRPNTYLYRISEGIATRYALVGNSVGSGAQGIAVAPSGVMYVSDQGGGVIWKVVGQNDSGPYVVGGFVDGPWGLALDRQGNLYAADPFGGVIQRFEESPGGVVRSTYADNLTLPESLAFESGGRLLVGQEDSISVIAPGGAERVLATGFSEVRGIAIANIPEPSILALFGLAFAGIGLARSKQFSGRHAKSDAPLCAG